MNQTAKNTLANVQPSESSVMEKDDLSANNTAVIKTNFLSACLQVVSETPHHSEHKDDDSESGANEGNKEEQIKSAIGGIISLWFSSAIKNRQSCENLFDLKPHSAICLALMTTRSISGSDSIAARLGRFGLNMLERDEASIFVEYGMESLREAGLVKLDARGKKEYVIALDTRLFGLRGVHWTLTKAGAKRVAPFYCSHIGEPSSYQKQAIEDMLAANKASIRKGRGLDVVKDKKPATVKVKKTAANIIPG